MKYKYTGNPVQNWYGMNLTTDMEIEIPDNLLLKAENHPDMAKTKGKPGRKPKVKADD